MAFTRKRIKKKDPDDKKIKTGKIKHNITFIDGIRFDSEMESKYYTYLKELKEKNIVKEFTLQPEFVLQDKFIVVDGQVIEGSNEEFNKLKRKHKASTIQSIKYKSDFKVEYADGRSVIVDTKGIETTDFKIKKKMFEYKYPNLTLEIVILRGGEWISYYEYKKAKNLNKKKK